MREVLEDLEQAEGKKKIERKAMEANNATNASEEGSNNTPSISNNGYVHSVVLVCLDASDVKLESATQIPLANLDPNNFVQSLRNLYELVAKTRFPKRWGDVDATKIFFRLEWSDPRLIPLIDESTFRQFWSAYSTMVTDLQLVVYTRRSTVKKPLVIGTDIDPLTSIPIAPLTPRKSPPRITNPGPGNLDMISESLASSPTFQQ
ncbi:11234_t:CDS:2, partial [Ambispora leptoticha]